MQVYADEAAARKAADAARGRADGAITFLKEQEWKIGVVHEPVTRHDLVERLVVPGEILPAAGAKAVVTSPMAGRLLPPPRGPVPQGRRDGRGGPGRRPRRAAAARPPGRRLLANRAQVRTLQADLQARLKDAEMEIRKAKIELDLARTGLRADQDPGGSDAIARKQLDEAEHDFRIAEAAYQGKRRLREPYEQTSKTRGDHAPGRPPTGGGRSIVGVGEPPPWQASGSR